MGKYGKLGKGGERKGIAGKLTGWQKTEENSGKQMEEPLK